MTDETPKYADGGPIIGNPLGRPERVGIGPDGVCIYEWTHDEGGDNQRE